MDVQEQQFLAEILPPELVSKVNIISIHTGQSAASVITASLTAGLEILEDITTRQYAYLKIDDQGQAYNLSGEPLKM